MKCKINVTRFSYICSIGGMFIKYIAKEIIPPYGKSINKRFITTYVYPANILYMNFYEYIVY